ncbi:MAG: hypothetical protein HKN73_17480 [Gemmatimonadetes bacterium]|nr:hypothetical protein [Gemmatimonadota bacterium]
MTGFSVRGWFWARAFAQVGFSFALLGCTNEEGVTPPGGDEEPRLVGVLISPPSGAVEIDGTLQLTAQPVDQFGNPVDGVDVVFASEAPTVASVDATGLVTGLEAGIAEITATAGEVLGVAPVTVHPPGAQSGADPELPRIYLNTSRDHTASNGDTVRLGPNGDLQNAIDNAQPGDAILLAQGATYSGPIVLRDKTGSGWITIATDMPLPAEGTRVDPSDPGPMAVILAEDVEGAIVTEPRASFYRIAGIEVRSVNDIAMTGLILLGATGDRQDTLGEVPHDIVLDHVYVHGSPTVELQRCIALNAARLAVVDSYVSECHYEGVDSQAIVGWNGPGPFKIVNNYLEGAAENIMFGGADPSIDQLTPSDIEIRRNHIRKPPEWFGDRWSVKNLFELKHARRVLVESNVFENNWANAQVGFAVVLKSENQDGTCPWCVTEHVTFRYNLMQNVTAGFNMSANSGGFETVAANNILFQDNVVYNLAGDSDYNAGNNRLWQLIGQLDRLTIRNNTTIVPGDGSMTAAMMSGGSKTNLVVIDNIMGLGEFGWFGDGVGGGVGALNHYAPGGYVFESNAFTGDASDSYPPGNFFVDTYLQIGFRNFLAADFGLAADSPFKGRASGGGDPGADWDSVMAGLTGVRSN